MIEPIIVKKDPKRYDHLPYRYESDVFKRVIDAVDLYDLTNHIKSLDDAKWVPSCYWTRKKKILAGENLDEKIFFGDINWAIYSYLIINKLLIIEDKYFGSTKQSRTNKHKSKSSYFNPYRDQLYKPINDRLLSEKYLEIITTIDFKKYYKIGRFFTRDQKLNELIN